MWPDTFLIERFAQLHRLTGSGGMTRTRLQDVQLDFFHQCSPAGRAAREDLKRADELNAVRELFGLLQRGLASYQDVEHQDLRSLYEGLEGVCESFLAAARQVDSVAQIRESSISKKRRRERKANNG